MSPAEFLRFYHLRAPHLMWMRGAGASAASGIRTTGDVGSGKTKDEWQEAARLSVLDWQDYLLPTMEIRKKHRDHLSHGRLWILEDASSDAYFTDYPRLGCAFMTIIAALCGYSGPIVTHPFRGDISKISDFREIAENPANHFEKEVHD